MPDQLKLMKSEYIFTIIHSNIQYFVSLMCYPYFIRSERVLCAVNCAKRAEQAVLCSFRKEKRRKNDE